MINKRAARFITGNYTREHGNTDKNMKQLGWSPLSDRRDKIKLTMLYKIRYNLVHIPTDDLLPNRRKPLDFFVPFSAVDCHLHSFYPSTIRLWNALPADIKSSKSVSTFKTSLDTYSTTTISHNY